MKDQIGPLKELKPQPGDVICYHGITGMSSPVYLVDNTCKLYSKSDGIYLQENYYEGGSQEHCIFRVISRSEREVPKRTAVDVFETIINGDFYVDYDESTQDLKILRECLVNTDKDKRISDLNKKLSRVKAKQKALHKKFGDVYTFMLNNC